MDKYILWPARPDVRQRLLTTIATLPDEKTWEVVIKPYVSKKTAEQLGYLWRVVIPTIRTHVEDSTGDHYSDHDIYEYMIDEFAEHSVVTINGKPKVIRVSASRMNIKQMSAFIDRVIIFAATEIGCVVPDPKPL